MQAHAESPILVADVGGTNLNLALLLPEASRFRMLRQARFQTQEEGSLLEPIQRFLELEPTLRPQSACLAGAGPVLERRIHLTNAPWDIDAASLERSLGFPVHLVNDFIALSCGVAHLDLTDAAAVSPMRHGDASLPVADPEGLALVVGPGTGLGVGFFLRTPTGVRAYPSEGGHIGLPVFDEETLALWRFLAEGLPGPPGAEMAVSGPGLVQLFQFLLDTKRVPWTPVATAILARPLADRPSIIATESHADEACHRAITLFVDLYARICADLCAAFLPTGGLFLAGGIVAKNPGRFLAEGRFMTRFEQNYRAHLDRLTRNTPVFLVHDYDLSLRGAAHAPGCVPMT